MKKKLIRITTADISLDGLLKGQLKFLNQYFEVVGVAKDTGVLKEVSEREGIRVVDAPLERPISLVKDIKGLWFLYRLFRKEKPWCVHANTPKGSLLAMIAAWFACVPHRVYTLLVYVIRVLWDFQKNFKRNGNLYLSFANKVIPEGNGVKQILQEDHITKKELTVILNGNINGVDIDYFSPDHFTAETRIKGKPYTGNKEEIRRDLNLSNDDFVFIFIGRIVGDKGMNELSDSMKRFQKEGKNVKLLLVGRFESELDPLKSGNEDFLRNNPNVRFVGYQTDVRPFFIAADVLVFPSYREGFPNVVLQAGAMGLPSIVTNINGCNEIIKEGLNGKIFPSKDTDALFREMTWCVENKELIKVMASQSRKMIVDRFRQEEVWKATLKEYEKLEK